jgi:Uma2 family endonuclease
MSISIDPSPYVAPLFVPTSAMSVQGFRDWARSDAFPESGEVSFLNGQLYIDMSPEELHKHNKVKTAITSKLHSIASQFDLGDVYSDRMLVTNPECGLSTEPDASFVAYESMESGRARLVGREGVADEAIELEGGPDMVLEVVSRSSAHKDKTVLRDLYYRAGVREYWLVDALGVALEFQILRAGPDHFGEVDAVDGWLNSEVFSREFRLDRQRDRIGNWRYVLEDRAAS